jgi:tetratricopeptide (TPR) repeat protein
LVGQYEIAIEIYKEILQKEPKNLYAKYSLGVVYQRLNQFKQAKNIYYELLQGDAENKDEVINNIIAILIEESPREAIYMLNRLTVQNPEKHYLFASMALAYEKISDYDSAIKNYVRALELDYNNVNYAYNLGVLYDQNKEYEKALEMYASIVKNSDNSNREIAIDSVKRRIEKIKQII